MRKVEAGYVGVAVVVGFIIIGLLLLAVAFLCREAANATTAGGSALYAACAFAVLWTAYLNWSKSR